jgi:2-aminophenol/2-amino-5-chlorophenol 1,6-dioxygenase alpha subunit
MSVVSAFLLPGNPLTLLKGDNPPWRGLADAARSVGQALASSRPDVLLIYSTQWLAVLDQLWQTRPHSSGRHVDENWYEYGDLQVNLRCDVALAQACIAAANQAGVRSKAVDYEDFPIDTGTIVANAFVNPDGKIPAIVAANNLYHSFEMTEKLGQIAASQASLQGKRAAVLAIGGLSASYFDHDIDIATDRIVRAEDDRANRELLEALSGGSAGGTRAKIEHYIKSTKADMGLKHLAWLLGATGGFKSAAVRAYGATYGAGAAVVEFTLT